VTVNWQQQPNLGGFPLERVFFHDVLNSTGGLLGIARVLRKGSKDSGDVLAGRVYRLTEQIINEIQGQRELLAAENAELSTQPVRMNSREFLGKVAEFYREHEAARERLIEIDCEAADVEFTSDQALLTRVMGNMIKNALEASDKGEKVKSGCNVNGEQIEFWVHNSGCMPRDVQLQVFQRSFSTKEMGRGLGTYGMKLLTERYLMGSVTFSSSQEEGTRFTVRLPLHLGDE